MKVQQTYINKIFLSACVEYEIKDDVKMRGAYAAGVRQPQEQVYLVYCFRLDSVLNSNALFREGEVRGTRLLCVLNLLI